MTRGRTDGENLSYVMGQPMSAEIQDSCWVHGAADLGSEWRKVYFTVSMYV